MSEDRICPHTPYGVHIDLTCEDHPDKRWNTKNISYIGARSLFYNLDYDPNMGPECTCSIRKLIPVCLECNKNID